MHAGAEIAVPAQVASTKAYTSQIVSLVMIAVLLAEDSHAKAARRAEIIKSLLALPDAVRAALAAKDTVRVACVRCIGPPSSRLIAAAHRGRCEHSLGI